MLANKECQAALEVLQESPLYDCRCKRGMKKELQCLQIYWSIHLGLTEGKSGAHPGMEVGTFQDSLGEVVAHLQGKPQLEKEIGGLRSGGWWRVGSKFAEREVAECPAVEVDRVGRSFQTAVPGRTF